jgi:hypothetical protein
MRITQILLLCELLRIGGKFKVCRDIKSSYNYTDLCFLSRVMEAGT